MNKLILFTIATFLLTSCSTTKHKGMNNMIATMQVDEPISGVCDNSKVIAILPLPGNGQTEAKHPSFTDEELVEKLNSELSFLRSNPNYNGKGMVSLIVNCKGEMVKCEIDNTTNNAELDEQILKVFEVMKTWEAGTVNGNPVDTVVLYSFEIENGVLSL